MATFSLGSGNTPGAPGVYINEQAGRAASAAVADFSTVYMLVETEEDVSVTRFPFNTPIPITSLNDYRELIRVGISTVPTSRIPLLSYNCVNEFFQNAQVGDLRVVRVGTPNQIVEIEFFPSGTKLNTTDLPSALMAGNKVYVQMLINGQKLVAGDGSTGYTADGEWLGVPVVIPVNYVAGDEANNRKISAAISTAVAAAIESNPAIHASVHVRSAGLVNDIDPSSNSQNSFVSIASATYDGNVSVVTQVLPIGSNFVFMQNTYDVENIVGGSVQLERVPQDYVQTIDTAFDGQQDQGYLITPTAYAQFDAEGRALVGAAAADHCANNNYKWMALADPGPFLVTDVNKYSEFTPHQAAANLIEGNSYLIDNAIYKWIGVPVTYNKLTYQSIIAGENSATAVNESANLVADDTKVGLLDSAQYTVTAIAAAVNGIFDLGSTSYWPVTLPIQKVNLSGAGTGNDFTTVSIQGGASGVNLNGTEVYVIAAPYDLTVDSEYSQNRIFLALTAGDASNIYNAVVFAGGSINISAPPTGSVYVPTPTGDTAQLSYSDPYWDLPVNINGQSSDLIQNISGQAAGVNTLHLPGTLQDPTAEYVLNWISRTLMNPSVQITSASGITGISDGTAVIACQSHGLTSGQIVYFARRVTVTPPGGSETILFGATTNLVTRQFYVKVINTNTFVLANSLANYSTGNFIPLPVGTISTFPALFYSQILGRGIDSITSAALTVLPMVRGRKYAFDSNTIWNQSLDASLVPTGFTVANNPNVSIYLNNSSAVLGEDQVSSFGENISSVTQCGYLPKLNLVAPDPTPTANITNAYCVPVVDQSFQSEAYFVPSIDSILVGTFNPTLAGTIGPAATFGVTTAATTAADGTYNNVSLTADTGSGIGATATVVVAGGLVTGATVVSAGKSYVAGDVQDLPVAFGGAQLNIATIDNAGGSIASVVGSGVGANLGISAGDTAAQVLLETNRYGGCYLDVVGGAGTAPDGQPVVPGDRIAVTLDKVTFSWTVVPADALGGDMSTVATVCYGSQTELVFTPEQAPPTSLWRFDAITSTEIIDDALRGVGFNGDPQAEFVEAGIDNVNRLLDDSQRYFNPLGFIAYYGPWIENGSGQYIPPSPYVTGVAVRRYRAEGYQFPPAGVMYQLADAVAAQIPVNSAQQNLLNPKGCNIVRALPGYPQTAVFIWGGRTRVNEADAQQRLYQFVNTRVILNVVYGSLRNAFDSQIFSVIDGFGVIFNQIISVGNSVLNQLFVRGALFGARPSDAFQVICDDRINTSESLENGIVNAKVFVTPVPTLERIQIDLIRVAVGKMQQELDIQGLGQSNQ